MDDPDIFDADGQDETVPCHNPDCDEEVPLNKVYWVNANPFCHNCADISDKPYAPEIF